MALNRARGVTSRLDCDVAVVGGGPAACAAALTLARAGYGVVLLADGAAGQEPEGSHSPLDGRARAAEAAGAAVVRGFTVTDCASTGDGAWRLRVRDATGDATEMSAGVVVDVTDEPEREGVDWHPAPVLGEADGAECASPVAALGDGRLDLDPLSPRAVLAVLRARETHERRPTLGAGRVASWPGLPLWRSCREPLPA